MAFVRWRGNSAQLLTTIYASGRSRQILLANFHGLYYAPENIKEMVVAKFPQITVDWTAVNKALAAGPPGDPSLTPEQWDWVTVAEALRRWAREFKGEPHENSYLLATAQILMNWMARGLTKPDNRDEESIS